MVKTTVSSFKMVTSQNFLLYSIACFCIIFLTPIVASDEESNYYTYSAKEYPDLIKKPKSCTGNIRHPPTSICDPENILNIHDAKYIDNLIAENSNGTYCFCQSCTAKTNGLNIKVAIVAFFERRANKTLSESADIFAEYLRLSWNVSPNCNNDVIIFVSTEHELIRMSVGIKAQKVLSQSNIEDITNDGQRLLKLGDLEKCLENMLKTINAKTQSYDPRLGRFGLNSGLTLYVIAGAVGLILIIGAVFYCAKRDTNKNKRQRELNKKQKYSTLQKKPEEKNENCQVLM